MSIAAYRYRSIGPSGPGHQVFKSAGVPRTGFGGDLRVGFEGYAGNGGC